MTQYVYYLLAGVLAVMFHCCLKYNTLSKDASHGNVEFKVNDYIRKDKISIIMSFLSVGLWLLCFGEAAAYYPGLQGFKITSFAAMGLLGSYIIQLLTGVSRKYIRNVIKKSSLSENKE